MNISTDRSGAKIIVFVIAAIIVGSTGFMLYKVMQSQKQGVDLTAICKERGVGTHVIDTPGENSRHTKTVILCNRDGTAQELQQP